MTQSINELLAASLGANTEFDLHLESGCLRVLDIVRRLPQRRVVMRCQWDGQQVFVKAFLGKSAERYALRDMQGVERFQQAGILTPAFYQHEKSLRYQASILVFEAVQQASNVTQFFSKADSAQRAAMLRQLSVTLGRQHRAGLLQNDMHPNNFLVRSLPNAMQIYSLDGDGVRYINPLGDQQALQNLATLLSKFDVLQVLEVLPLCLQDYATERKWPVFSQGQVDDFIRLMRRMRLKMLADYADNKVFRRCSDVSVEKKWPFVMRLSNRQTWHSERLLQALPVAFDQANYLKQGNTCTVVRYAFADQSVVIKRYNLKNFWHALNRGLRRSRAAISWGNAHRLSILGIATGQAMALIEKRVLGWQMQAYFIAAYVDGISLRDLSTKFNPEQVSQAAQALADLFYRMHLIGLSHGDCKADNFKFAQQHWYLLDLDSMQQHLSEKRALQAHIRDLKRLFANWKADDSLYNVMLSAFAKRYGNDPVLQMAGLQ